MAESLLAQAMEQNIQKHVDDLSIPMETLKKAKNAAVARVMSMLSKRKDPNDPTKEIEVNLSLADIEKILRIVKTELGEPITISKNENTNTEKLEAIHIVMSQKSIDEYKRDMGEDLPVEIQEAE